MSTPEDARKLVEYGNRRSVGGNIIKMTFVSILDKAVKPMCVEKKKLNYTIQ